MRAQQGHAAGQVTDLCGVQRLSGQLGHLTAPHHALVPLGLYSDPIRYPSWLRQTIERLA
jgi:hypothetical protein